MLRLIHAHLRPSPSSLVFLVLPLPCVTNSRYLDQERLIAIMRAVGFELVRERWKEGGRVGYWLFAWRAPVQALYTSGTGKGQKVKGATKSGEHLHRKVMLRDGPGFNNFAICLPPASDDGQ